MSTDHMDSGLPINLDDLIHARAVEDNRREFKAGWDDNTRHSILRTICAFANDLLNLNGGYIILGIETANGLPILPPRGLAGIDLEQVQKEIRGQCKGSLDPEYQPLLFPAEIAGRPILVVWAPGGDNRPYQAPGRDKKQRVFWVRQGAETVEAQGELLRMLMERTAKVPFDDRRNHEARIEDISPTLVRRFLSDVRSDLVRPEVSVDDRELYRRLRITSPANGQEAPRNVALLFFHEDPERFFRGARVEVAQFADDAGGNLIEERILSGPVPHQIRGALEHLNSLADALIRKVPGKAEVEKTVAYPYEAMEEAIVNGFYHRSYEACPEPIKIYLYPDRMEIISYPGPVPGIERSHLVSGSMVPPVPARNRRVGEFLKELRLAEGRGTGLPKIRRRMKENGSPDPLFDFDAQRSYFRVTLPAHPRYVVLHALREGAHLWAVGERAASLEHLKAATGRLPSSGALAGQLIEYSIASDNIEAARETFERFHSETERTEAALPYLKYAAGLLNLGRNEQAAKVLDLIPPTGPDDLIENAILRKRARDHQAAHRLFVRADASRSNDPKVLHEFAQTKNALSQEQWKRQNKQESRRLLREAAELLHRTIQLCAGQPVREAWIWFDLARVSDRLNEPVTVVEQAFLKAINLKPDEPRFQQEYRIWKERK